MKKLLLSLSTLLFLINLSFAGVNGTTDDDDKPAKITINAGIVSSILTNTPLSEARVDWMVGVQRDVKIAPLLRLNVALFYNRIGTGFESLSSDFDTKLNYLQLPVGLKVKLGPVYGLGGISGAYRVAAKQGDVKIDKDQLNRFDFGAHLGLGVKFLIFSLEGRFNWGLVNVAKNDPLDAKNGYFQLMLGVGIP